MLVWPSNYINLRGHGGSCCGMSHILSFPDSPERVLLERKTGPTQSYKVGSSAADQFPQQTALERLEGVINNIEKGYTIKYADAGIESHITGRSQGIIEIVLNHLQLPAWEETLKKLKFKEVNKCKNSNTNNTIHVFHRNSGEK